MRNICVIQSIYRMMGKSEARRLVPSLGKSDDWLRRKMVNTEKIRVARVNKMIVTTDCVELES